MRGIAAVAALSAGAAFGHDFGVPSYDPATKSDRPHFTSERPLSKRQRRRLRGKGKVSP